LASVKWRYALVAPNLSLEEMNREITAGAFSGDLAPVDLSENDLTGSLFEGVP
jgi:hypothetical protein